MTKVLISMGSNIDKEINLPAAIALLQANPNITVLAVSPVLATLRARRRRAAGRPAQLSQRWSAG